jgi:superfamily II DNA/RNA helicase
MHTIGPRGLGLLLLLAAIALPATAALAVGPRPSSAAASGKNERRSPPRSPKRSSNAGKVDTDRSRAEAGYSLRRGGVKTNSGRVKPPQWEREGDDLYAQFTTNTKNVNMVEAREMLAQLAFAPNVTESKKVTIITETPKNDEKIENQTESQTENKMEETKPKKPPPAGTLWGTLSVGPILRSRLVDRAGLASPTAVQEAAFSVILKGENAVIASPTGTGKSLAYLIPLLARFGLKTPATAIIVTPTVELALQLQREVDDRLGYREGGNNPSALHVVKYSSSKADDPEESDDEMLINSIGDAPFLAGTPKTLLRLLAEAKRSRNNKLLAQTARNVLTNPKCIVLDEADRLLQTEQIARDAAAAKQPKQKGSWKTTSKATATTQTELLLRELAPLSHGLSRLQLVCASATVGRTLRKQIMGLIGAPSVDKASVLITADDRTKKNADLRKASWVPSGISHSYRLISTEAHSKKAKDTAAAAAAATASQKEGDDEDVHEVTMNALWDTMQQLKPATALVFPGRAGVDRVREGLVARGLQDVRTLRDGVDTKDEDDDKLVAGWESTTVFIVGEKFGRGLDLPGVDYVFMMSPPSSAAGYAHMAGRTGRNDRPGKAVMLVRPKEASKVVAIAGALGLTFLPVEEVIDVAVVKPRKKTVKPPKETAEAGEVIGSTAAAVKPKKKKTAKPLNETVEA